VAIIGPTGAGKSTIIKLLLRLYEPAEGTILLDNLDIKAYSKAYLRNHLGVALQNSILFSATIRENLRAVNPGIETAKMMDALKMASIASLIENNEAGLNKMIGEKGINVSGGQKQRLAISRLLLKKSDIFILDDVTSYLDELNEQTIMESLRKAMGNCTCILISHKLSSIFFAEKIIVLSQGTVKQSGRRNVLEKLDGYYNIIFNLQTEGKTASKEITINLWITKPITRTKKVITAKRLYSPLFAGYSGISSTTACGYTVYWLPPL
ncbi:MAG: ATP-binding cassette domain-containing protein, partial [Bacteroidales bacterium]|nr:ATP-binding cassette domain-containing protein [Bacteroidales bacterium]